MNFWKAGPIDSQTSYWFILKKTGRFRERYGIGDRTAVLFAGVLGPSQGLEQAIELASRLRDREDIVFLLVGDGAEKPRLQRKAQELGLNNVLFKPFVSKDEYPYLVKDADIGLTCLSHKVKTPVVPGKIQGYMAAGVPILGILNDESDGHELVREANAGLTVHADDIDAAEKALTSLLQDQDLRRKYGSSGHAYAAQYLSKQACIDSILRLVKTSSSV